MEFTARQIAAYIGGEVVGDENATVCTFAKIEEGTPGALSFLANPKYTDFIYDTDSSVVLVNADFVPERPVKATLVKCANAYESLAKLMALYESTQPRKSGVSSLAYVAETATIGNDVYIAPFAYIGDGVTIGDGTVINPHVTIYHDCRIGARCILHAGCVIGADGFGFAPAENGYEKIPQIGIVIVEDDVEIGANACIDRSTMGATVISRGVKIDNLVQIAHNVVVGSNTVMAAQCGIAGSTKIGEWCMFGGQTGVAGHLHIGNKVQVGGNSGISGNVRDGQTIMGYPAFEHAKFARSAAAYKHLPEIYRDVTQMKKEIERLKAQLEANTQKTE